MITLLEVCTKTVSNQPPFPLQFCHDIGTVEYYFSEVSVWQVSHPSGIETFYFPNGRVESHLPGDGREILLPGGQGAMQAFVGGSNDTTTGSNLNTEVPVSVKSLRKETLMPMPVVLFRSSRSI